MKKIKKRLKKYLLSTRTLSKSIAIIGGGLIGFVIGNWFGMALGIIIGYIFEALLAKGIQKTIIYNR